MAAGYTTTGNVISSTGILAKNAAVAASHHYVGTAEGRSAVKQALMSSLNRGRHGLHSGSRGPALPVATSSKSSSRRKCAQIPGKRAAVSCTNGLSELESASGEDNQVARQDSSKAEDNSLSGAGGVWGFAISKILPFKRPAQSSGGSTVTLKDRLKETMAQAQGTETWQDADAIITRVCEVATEYQEVWAARENKLVGDAATLKDKNDKLEAERRQLVKKLEFIIEEAMTNTTAMRKRVSDAEAALQQAEASTLAQEEEAQRLGLELAAVTEQLEWEKAAVQDAKTELAAAASLQYTVSALRDSLAEVARERDAVRGALAIAVAVLAAQLEETAEAKRQLVSLPGLAGRITYLENALSQSRRLLNVNARASPRDVPASTQATAGAAPLQEVAARVALARMQQPPQSQPPSQQPSPLQSQPQPSAMLTSVQQVLQQQQQQQRELEEARVQLEQGARELAELKAQNGAQQDQLRRLSQVQGENEALLTARAKLEEEVQRLTAAFEAEKARADEATKPPPKENWKPFFGPREQYELKARARQLRSQYVDLGKPYSEQGERVEALVKVLLEEFDAPEDWTRRYVETSLRTLFEIPSMRFGNIWAELEE